MTEEECFLLKIRTNPAEDTVRLVYADWLDEHAGTLECSRCKGRGVVGWDYVNGVGQPPKVYDCPECTQPTYVPVSDGRRERAEFIRVQVGLAPLHRHGHGPISPHGGECPDCFQAARLAKWEGKLFTASHARGWGLGDDWRHTVHGHTMDPSYGATIPAALFSRGFVSHITCTAAAFLGETCRTCNGGRIAGQWDNKGNTCPRCHGEKRTEGLARELFRTHPIERVTLSDLIPVEIAGLWSLFRRVPGSVQHEPMSPHFCPAELFDEIDQPDCRHAMELAGTVAKSWTTRDGHAEPLSAACVRLGRERAGLT